MSKQLLKSGIYADCKNGSLVWRDLNLLEQVPILFDGKTVVVSFTEFRSQRSLEQNRLYWGVIVDGFLRSFAEQGHQFTIPQVHDYLKRCFLSYTLPIDGVELQVVGSTADLTIDEFVQYVEDCNSLHIDRFGRGLL
jgi:hypothetical protein